MAALDDLKTLLIGKAGLITFDLDKAECLADIDSWYDSRAACDALGATDISSYTIGRRTFQKKQLDLHRQEERYLYQRIMSRLYCAGASLVDMRDLGGFSR